MGLGVEEYTVGEDLEDHQEYHQYRHAPIWGRVKEPLFFLSSNSTARIRG